MRKYKRLKGHQRNATYWTNRQLQRCTQRMMAVLKERGLHLSRKKRA